MPLQSQSTPVFQAGKNDEPDFSIRTRRIPVCPVCGAPGDILHRGVHDRMFGAPGAWDFKRCVSGTCRVCWLDPAPLGEELWKAYKKYYTHAPQSEANGAGWARKAYRAVKLDYLSTTYGYPSSAASGLSRRFGFLLYALPICRSSVDLEIRRLARVQNGLLLDVGCGTGEWMAHMQARGWRAHGLDFDEAAVKTALSVGMEVSLGSIEDQQYPSDTYDAVTLNHVIEHLPNPLETLRECHRVLKPGGTLFLATPNIQSWGHQLFREHWRGLEPPRHLQIFSPGSLRSILKKAGFETHTVRTHPSFYVFFHSLRIRSQSQPVKYKVPAPLLSWSARTLNFIEQMRLFLTPQIGECIDAVATKKS